MQIVEVADAKPTDTGKTRQGEMDDRVMLEGEEGAPDNFRLLLERPITDWTTPRHRHDFDQIRLALRGDLEYAPGKILPEGSVAYFPAGVYYGPQVKAAGSLLALFQCGGPSGRGYSSNRQKKAAYEAMLKRGKFENGVYTYIDEKGRRHNQDAAEARRELITGTKEEYTPRYQDHILMNPRNYAWLQRPGAPGVAQKWLGTFTERELRVGFLRMEKGASVDLGMHVAPEALFLVAGDVSLDDHSYGQHTAFSFVAGEGPKTVGAVSESELLYIQLGKF